ncbi:hypothetical protein TNCT_689511 [Trichonephila clavata]|uniref:Uncharacterized protein n=1 Tax=Trichonephila clavata TaxID=2740835 RepID=A0A8X6HA07_TRICU|nr:hypothetical protein TNCT_689511 [Trichonephila clavata]
MVWMPEDSKVIETSVCFQKPHQSSSGAVLVPPGLKFSDHEVVENGDDDEIVNNIPVSLPQNSDSETDEDLNKIDTSVVPVKITWKRMVVPEMTYITMK